MLIDFTVENYLSIREPQTLSFEPTKDKKLKDYYIIQVPDKDSKRKPLPLLKLGVMYGANASGKSNFLSALSFLNYLAVNTKSNKSEVLKYEPFALDKTKNSKFTINFVANHTKYNYMVEFNKKCVVYEELNEYQYLTSKLSRNVYIRETDELSQTPKIKFGDSISVDDDFLKTFGILTLWNETVIAGFSKISADIIQLTETRSWFGDYLDNYIAPHIPLSKYTNTLISNGKINKRAVVMFLKNADLNITDITIKKMEDNPEESTHHKSKFYLDEMTPGIGNYIDAELTIKHNSVYGDFSLPFEVESAGTQRYYGLAGVMLNLCNNSVFIGIDELESSLHSDLYKAFVLTYLQNAKNSQLLFTTHNREFLQDKDILRKDALWIANKKEDASTEIYSFADFDTTVLRETTSWYNAFATGKLGGVPNPSNDLLFFTEE